VHFLVTSAAEAFDLTQGQPFVLGRSADADLVARSSDVSRQHARVLWTDGEHPHVEDLGGRHGTFLNRARLEPHSPHSLTHGDQVRLASSTCFWYLSVAGQADLGLEIDRLGIGDLTSEIARQDIETKRRTRTVKRNASAGASAEKVPMPAKGSLQAIPGSQLLTLLRDAQATGVLLFFDGQQKGELRVHRGNLLQASMGRVQGQQVLSTLGTLHRGTFRFSPEALIPPSGDFAELAVEDLLLDLHDAKASGILSVRRPDGALTGRLVLIKGLVRSAGLGKLLGTQALKKVGELTAGRFEFEVREREELDGRLQTPRGKREQIE
jgi:FHA domain/Domain of unknown function (DUF4388)